MGMMTDVQGLKLLFFPPASGNASKELKPQISKPKALFSIKTVIISVTSALIDLPLPAVSIFLQK